MHKRARLAIVASTLAIALSAPAFPADEQTGRVHYEFDLAPGRTLSLTVRSGDVVIEGTDNPKILISFDGDKADQATDVKVTFKEKDDTVECVITDGPRNDFRILIAVPRQLNLIARMPFGALQISEIVGSKDVRLRAGELDIAVGNTDDYAAIDASVGTGEIDMSALGVETGGFFRKYHKDGPGTFRLLAHIGAGQLTLR